MVEVSVSRKAGLPLFTECSISVDADEGLGEDGWWGGALAVFGFLGPETEANAVRMEPMGSCRFGVFLLPLVVLGLTLDAVFWDGLWWRAERRGWTRSSEATSEEGIWAFFPGFWRVFALFCFALTSEAAGSSPFASRSSPFGRGECPFSFSSFSLLASSSAGEGEGIAGAELVGLAAFLRPEPTRRFVLFSSSLFFDSRLARVPTCSQSGSCSEATPKSDAGGLLSSSDTISPRVSAWVCARCSGVEGVCGGVGVLSFGEWGQGINKVVSCVVCRVLNVCSVVGRWSCGAVRGVVSDVVGECRRERCSRCDGLDIGDIFSLCFLLGDERELDSVG